MSNLKTGDTVWLKSGGPQMTIHDIDNDNYSCRWFDEKNKLQRGTFKANDLTKENPNELPTGSRL